MLDVPATKGSPSPASRDIEAILGVGRKAPSRLFRWRNLFWAVVAVVAIVGFYGVWSLSATRAAVTYATEPATRGNLTVIVTATGSAQPITQVNVSSELSGTIRKVNVDYNSPVKAGQPIAELDTDKLKAVVENVRAKVDAAKAKVANPYRCPPSPYERISMMAHALKTAGKTNCKIVIIDPKEAFSKQGLFLEGWAKHYKGMVEWLGPKVHDGVKSVDPKTNTVVTGFETYKNAALVNVIPAQMAGKIARDAQLVNASGFCPIDPTSMNSTMDSNIYVLGDACIAGDMPKSGFAANSQAKVAAMMIRSELTKSATFPARYTNTCWSLIETNDAVKVGGSYEPKDGKIAAVETFTSKPGEPADLRKQTQEENMGWYAGITADIFG